MNQLSLAEEDLCEYFNQFSISRLNFITEITVLAEAPIDIVLILNWISRLDNLRSLAVHIPYMLDYWEWKDLVGLDRDEVQWWIDVLPNLKKFSITTTARQVHGSILADVESEVQAMIDCRERAVAAESV